MATIFFGVQGTVKVKIPFKLINNNITVLKTPYKDNNSNFSIDKNHFQNMNDCLLVYHKPLERM